MNTKTILKLMDIRTLTAGILPVILGSVYAYDRYDRFNLVNFFLLLIAMILLQSATNMFNDYHDYKRGGDGADDADEKAIVSGDVTIRGILRLMTIYVLLDFGIGIYLSFQTSFVVLLVGVVGGIIAILYSVGPCPISYTPFGELVSGATMGFGITSTVVYIQCRQLTPQLFIMAIPTFIYIALIMLSNNTCDMEKDADIHRHTLPNLIGFTAAKLLWCGSFLMLPITTALLVLCGTFPLYTLLTAVMLLRLPLLAKIVKFDHAQFNKGAMMGLISKLGMQFHVLIILGIVIDIFLK
jgi:1,4-dihydroxy-2-naphthoate octaprenyltransferase